MRKVTFVLYANKLPDEVIYDLLIQLDKAGYPCHCEIEEVPDNGEQSNE